uniref:DNA polymerase V subunit UmuC n=1 Tax=Klebsiella pneumoniae TaxID=573 RepID=A0A2P1BQ36_KLEPN|nr:DNA polymerase V subunit UmuC [Klebsiella pneumoniae]
MEQYSIDEMFLDLTGVEHCMDRRTSAGSCDSTCMTQPSDHRCGRRTNETSQNQPSGPSKEWKQFRGVLHSPGNLAQRTRNFHCSRSKDLGRGKPYCTQAQCSGHQNRARSGPDEPGLYPQNFSVVLERTVRELNERKLHVA